MTKRTKRIVAAAIVAAAIGVTAIPALADQPGPGDKQCVPGQNGNPQPGFKAGVCTNP
jgi:Spy/CpxP family protein refolding chaperone